MKRFLGADGAPRKLQKLSDTPPSGDPTGIVAWNINGLVPRSEKNADEVRRFLSTCGADVVFLSEVRLKAECTVKGHKKGDGHARDRRTPAGKAEELDRVRALFDRDAWHAPVYSLSDTKYAGSALLLRRGSAAPRRVFFHLPSTQELNDETSRFGADHEKEGRIILVEYETLLLLHTYSPNNGVDAPHFAKRAAWELNVRTFARDVRAWGRKPLVYVGDLNVAPKDADLSHPLWFKRENNISKRRLGHAPKGGWVSSFLHPDDEGQPGCSERECSYFRELLREGALVDAFRERHTDVDIEGPHFSYRGAPGERGAGRYYAKGMRIDHALVSVDLRVAACELLGRGVDCAGFMGSDHCPLRLRLGAADDSSVVVLGSHAGTTIDARTIEPAPAPGPPTQTADAALATALGEQRARAILTFANGSRGRVDVKGLDRASRMAVHRWAERRRGFTTASREVPGKGSVLQIKRVKRERAPVAASPAPMAASPAPVAASPAPAPTPMQASAPSAPALPPPPPPPRSAPPPPASDEAPTPAAAAPAPPASLHGRLARLRDTDAHRYLEKDLRKARDATCFIGRGRAGSATERYRAAAGDLANKARYSPRDRVFVSVNGRAGGRVACVKHGALSAAYRPFTGGGDGQGRHDRGGYPPGSQPRLQPGRAGAGPLAHAPRAPPLPRSPRGRRRVDAPRRGHVARVAHAHADDVVPLVGEPAAREATAAGAGAASATGARPGRPRRVDVLLHERQHGRGDGVLGLRHAAALNMLCPRES